MVISTEKGAIDKNWVYNNYTIGLREQELRNTRKIGGIKGFSMIQQLDNLKKKTTANF